MARTVNANAVKGVTALDIMDGKVTIVTSKAHDESKLLVNLDQILHHVTADRMKETDPAKSRSTSGIFRDLIPSSSQGDLIAKEVAAGRLSLYVAETTTAAVQADFVKHMLTTYAADRHTENDCHAACITLCMINFLITEKARI